MPKKKPRRRQADTSLRLTLMAATQESASFPKANPVASWTAQASRSTLPDTISLAKGKPSHGGTFGGEAASGASHG